MRTHAIVIAPPRSQGFLGIFERFEDVRVQALRAPLVVELIRPGGSASIRASCEAFMKTNGRWIAALILLGAGAFVAWNAAHSMP